MISEKINSQMGGESLIRKMFEKGIEMKAKYGAENVYDFSLGNPKAPTPEVIAFAIKKIIDTMPAEAIHSYMPNAGYPEVRVEVAKHLNPRYGTDYSEKDIIMTAGAGSALNLIMKSLLDQDDEVIVLAPYFPEYKAYVENYYGKIVIVPPLDDGSFLPDLNELEAAINVRTKAVIMDSPNNPSGMVYPESVITHIAEVLRKKEEEIGHPVYLISDEPYREICYIESAFDLSEEEREHALIEGADPASTEGLPWIPHYYENTIVTYSYSKALSIPGERIGNIVIPPSVSGHDKLAEAVTTSNLILGVVNAPSLMQRVIARAISAKPDVEFYKKNGDRLYEIVTERGFEAVKPEGAFYLWVKVPEKYDGDDMKFADVAADSKILLAPGSAFGCGGYVRLSYSVEPEAIERSAEAFGELV